MEITSKNVLEVYPTIPYFDKREDGFFEVIKKIIPFYGMNYDYVDDCIDRTCKLFSFIVKKNESNDLKLRIRISKAKAKAMLMLHKHKSNN